MKSMKYTRPHLDERAVLLGPQQRGAHEVGRAAARRARAERLHQRRAHLAKLTRFKETQNLKDKLFCSFKMKQN